IYSSFGLGPNPRQDLRPTLVAFARALAGESGMRQAHGRDPILLLQIKTHEALSGIPLPIRQPREREQVRTLDGAILPNHLERPPAYADAAHHPSTAGAHVRLHAGRL